jgi:hypothetical protein
LRHRLEKNLRIIDELVGYCYKKKGRKLQILLECEEKCTYIKIETEIIGLEQKDIDYLNETLNQKRQHEVEESYWLASGEENLGEELMLVGVMVDKTEIIYSNNLLNISLMRCE